MSQVKQLRTSRGWSQSQLAEFSGLSLSTIQRIEKGQRPSMESQKSLAAVFEVDLSELTASDDLSSEIDESTLNESEQRELVTIRKSRRLLHELLSLVTVVPLLMLLDWLSGDELSWSLWVLFGWGIFLVCDLLDVFDSRRLFGESWDKRQLEKRLGRKL